MLKLVEMVKIRDTYPKPPSLRYRQASHDTDLALECWRDGYSIVSFYKEIPDGRQHRSVKRPSRYLG
jgi:hypothetical protein